MKVHFFQEPELEFGTGKHIDIKFGLMNYGPLDFENQLAPKKIKLGIVGTPETIEGIAEWLEKVRLGIDAKKSKRPNLFPRFPGFGQNFPLCAEFVTEDQLIRAIPKNHFEKLCNKPKSETVLIEIGQLFLDEIEYLTQKTTVDVILCAYPYTLVEYLDLLDDDIEQINDEHVATTLDDSSKKISKFILHDFLKAKSMKYKKPIQIIRPGTYDDRFLLKRKHPSGEKRQIQDEATRAWNLYTALYYKAGGVPWRLLRDSTHLTTCYIGLSFYKSIDQSKLLTSTAQVFNERGEGVILRGGMAQLAKDDRQIHLSKDDAFTLLNNALEIYRREHKTSPARVVMHKSSIYNINEIEGFKNALMAYSIDMDQSDFLSITRSTTRLLRGNRYPPLRGTFLDTGDNFYVLYTRGSVDFYSAYPGLYIPLPLGFRCDNVAQTPLFLGQEILALTKMNWNNTQFDGSLPITLRAARQVGGILKYLDSDYEPYYRFYM